MSRVDDNDNQRIREMQENELRTRKDLEKKDADAKIVKSFEQVMRERNQRENVQQQTAAQHHAKDTKGKEAEKQQESFAQQLLKKMPKNAGDLQKRAAMSRAMAQGLQSNRSSESQKLREAESERVDDLMKKADDEKDIREKDMREEMATESKRAEEKDAKFHKIDADQENREREKNERNPQRRGDSGRGERKADAIEAPQAAQQQQQPRGIPREVVESIVNAIQAATHADGRTEMQVELKGSMLEGVRLKVRSQGGKVSCTFEGCDRELKNLLESSKGALMRSLEKRGLTLTSMKVV
jgi:hypothetical protein